MKLYSIEYIRDCTHYNKIVKQQLLTYGNYHSYDRAIEHIFEKIKVAAQKGENKTEFGFNYSFIQNKKNRKDLKIAIGKCIDILKVRLSNFGYILNVSDDGDTIDLNIHW
jgi:hypothetical protein